MFRIEDIQNLIVDNFQRNGGSGLISILPLDNIPVDIPNSWKYKPTCMPIEYKSRADAFANFKVRKDDIWIVTYPKCGTTWAQEMMWMLMNDLNFDEANSVDITERSIYFEFEGMIPTDEWKHFYLLNKQKSPRVIKSHLPISLLPRDIWRKKCKIVYVARDPKDAIISFYHHFTGMTPYKGSIEEFTEGILTDNMIYCSYWNHVLEFWLIREQPNILFLTFEDMKKDLRTILEVTSKFLKKEYTENQICSLMEHLSFDNMKKNSTCNNQGLVKALYAVSNYEYDEKTSFQFMRKGQVEGYKKEMSSSFVERINSKTKKLFEPYGLNLYYGDS
ncbi:luciferin sulfotransferase-like [Episyrphus balteatus]|uniref:luciferin sulfotransferase-like n=1 Tax=Episyrphus balteatus TaxID=286459 RepID=UPI002485D35E|nr:luciferin sulfotransferase-like [Episyrphus balteatus]